MHPLFDLLTRAIATDISQMVETGHDQASLLEELEAAKASGSLDALARLQQDLWRRPSPADFPYDEPNEWRWIAGTFPDRGAHARFAGGEADLADKLLAAWQGRCAGCQLGKVLEGTWPEDVKLILKAVGSWPLLDYANPVSDAAYEELSVRNEAFRGRYSQHNRLNTRGGFDRVAPDDDIHYAIVGQITIEKHGCDFTPEQAIETLIETTCASSVYASGRNMFRTYLFGIGSPWTAVFGNPCRQSLGAQIRCDPFGWNAPADPALAADMAFRDAVSSQTRNGIYSGIFFAVLMADVLAHGDVARAVDTATGYVPPRSRFAEMVRFVRDRCSAAETWEQVNADIYERYDHVYGLLDRAPMNHGLINAAIVLMSLLTGEGDFSRTIGIAVMAGRDTDCNGATAGSIMGCALGTKGIPAHWTNPFNDTIHTHLKDMPILSITGLARRTFETARRNARFET